MSRSPARRYHIGRAKARRLLDTTAKKRRRNPAAKFTAAELAASADHMANCLFCRGVVEGLVSVVNSMTPEQLQELIRENEKQRKTERKKRKRGEPVITLGLP